MEEKGAKKEPNGSKRTQIAEIGKDELLRRLFEGTGYHNFPLQIW